MKYILLLSSFCLSLNTANCQVQSDKEYGTLPEVSEKRWIFKQLPNFTIARDTAVSHSGSPSIKITGTVNDKNFQSFSQIIPIDVKHFTRIKASAFIKSEALQGEPQMWCQVWDKNRKKIGFASTVMPNTVVTNEGSWKKYNMIFNVDSEAHYLLLGAYLQGQGTAWFGDFKLDSLSIINEPASKDVLKFIHDFSKIVKTRSIYTDSLNWPLIENNIDHMAVGMKTVDEASVITQYVISKLRMAGDNHSFIQPKAVAREYATKNTNPEQPLGRLLESGVGYISVPGFGSTSDTAILTFATKIQRLIREIDGSADIHNWVVDLRNDTGGNMWPMLKGLEPLTSPGPIGYFIGISNGEETRHEWKTNHIKVSHPYTLKDPSSKVAVLIGPRTGSSGEMTTVAFVGRPNTRLFGEQSAGYITANTSIPLSDGSMLLLATSYVADRNGNRYLTKITPDVLVKPLAGEDAALKAAETWLLNR
ncbi:MAG: hypothetical protein K0S09_1421 [Sphingobacteriaceae bacterium]|nr:hypothetical protein [Sphingobacteriaceae bacterium]